MKKVDAAGNATCFYYDALHRLTDAGNGNEGSNAICHRFRYDNSSGVTGSTKPSGLQNYYGRMVEAATDGCGAQGDPLLTDEWFSYNGRGDRMDTWQLSPHSVGYYHIQAAYWPDDTLSSLNPNFSGYPSQTYTVDPKGGRIASVTASTGQNPLSSTSYDAADHLLSLTYGSGDSDIFTYDSNNVFLTQATYKVGAPPNQKSIIHQLGWNPNGTLGSLNITDPINSANEQNCNSYNYDALGRLTQVTCGSTWAQTFAYDTFGNIQKTAGSQMWNPNYDTANNNRYQSGWHNISYDGNGNLTYDTFNTYSWDPNWGNPATIGGAALVYDALGRMVEGPTSNGTREYVYAPGGSQVLAQMNGQTPVTVQFPLPGGGLAMYGATAALTYARPDWLGSARLVTNSSQTWVNDSAYAPFGEQYAIDNNGSSGFYDFTGQQQWTTPGLDDFLFRKYHPAQGRWIVPDPAGMAAVDITNPQTWNRYAYVMNNPLSFIDPLGLYRCIVDGVETDNCPGFGPQGGGGGGGGGFPTYVSGTCEIPGGPDGSPLTVGCLVFGGYTNGFGGGSGAGGGGGNRGCVQPSKVQSAVIPAVAVASSFWNKTLLFGLGGSGGVGFGKGVGLYGSGSVQIAVSPNGNAAYVISVATPTTVTGAGTYAWLTPSTKGAGFLGGSQFGFSNVSDPSQLAGKGVDASASMAAGLGIGADLSVGSGGTYQANVTLGFGAGGRGAAGAQTNTTVVPICRTW